MLSLCINLLRWQAVGWLRSALGMPWVNGWFFNKYVIGTSEFRFLVTNHLKTTNSLNIKCSIHQHATGHQNMLHTACAMHATDAWYWPWIGGQHVDYQCWWQNKWGIPTPQHYFVNTLYNAIQNYIRQLHKNSYDDLGFYKMHKASRGKAKLEMRHVSSF